MPRLKEWWFCCIHGHPIGYRPLVPEVSDDQAHCPGPDLPSTRIRCGDHSAERALVHHLSAVIPGPGGVDGRARGSGGAFDDSPVGDPVRSGIREALESILQARRYFLAGGRDLYRHPGKWHYLYRAVDKHGKTVDFLLRPDRGIAAAQAFFRKALASTLPRVPRKVTLDGHVPSRRALWLLRREHFCWRNVTVRTNKYLNNLIEQDHRAIKRRCASMAGFKTFAGAAIAIAGIGNRRFKGLC